MPKLDFCSILLFLACATLILVVIVLAINTIVNTYEVSSKDAVMYSRPTWYETVSVETTEITDSEDMGD